MLGASFIREHLDEVKANCRNRNVKADVDRVVQLDDERKRLVQQTQTVPGTEKQLRQVEADLRAALATIPNMSHPEAPVGTTAEDNKVLRTWGEPRKFDFPARDHVAIAEALDLVDFEAGSAVAGQKF